MLFQIDGFDVKRVDEYHLTGIVLDMFVRWEHRPPSTTEGRGENRNENRGESRAKPEQSKPDDSHYSEGLVSLTTPNDHIVRQQISLITPLNQCSHHSFTEDSVDILVLSTYPDFPFVTFP